MGRHPRRREKRGHQTDRRTVPHRRDDARPPWASTSGSHPKTTRKEMIQMDSDFGYSEHSIKEMLDDIGVSEEDQAVLYRTYDLPHIQRHAAYTQIERLFGKIQNPVAWFKASLRGNWKAPQGPTPNNRSCTFGLTKIPGCNFNAKRSVPFATASTPKRIAPTRKENSNGTLRVHQKESLPRVRPGRGVIREGRQRTRLLRRRVQDEVSPPREKPMPLVPA
jgi:hypothetical protein